MSLLIVAATKREADAVASWGGRVVVSGVGRVNAACATTEALLADESCTGVLSAGVAGSLPGSGLELGDIVVATACIYMEEGLATPAGFLDMAGLGFPLGDFPGNAVPVDDTLFARFMHGPAPGVRAAAIATVATCSGTDDAAALVRERTGAAAEAMEGAAVVHAARRRGLPGLEIRAISNSTGRRDAQRWDLSGALDALRRFGAARSDARRD